MPSEGPGILEKLLAIQQAVKVDKSRMNDFSKFKFWNKDDILDAVKPLCHEAGCVILCDDDLRILENGWVYVVTTATLTDCETGESVSSHGYAREQEAKTKFDASQITGAASTYAGKRALGNLFALDDSADADSDGMAKGGKTPPPSGPFNAHCRSCGARYQFMSAEQMTAYRCCPNPDYEVE